MKRTTPKSNAEMSVEEHINFLKSKSVVSISDLEIHFSILGQINDRFFEVTKSRDSWRIRAENAERRLKEISPC